jgi:hypothetical protein
MRCKDFDAHIDEMLSGLLQPDANEHMRQCERCTSYFRARTAVQNAMRALATAPASPSRATDRAVMDSYRRLQQRRAAAAAQPSAPRPAARLFSFPSRGAAARGSRRHWRGAAVAAMLLAMVGSTIRLWNGATVGSPNVSTPLAVASGTVTSPAPKAVPEATPATTAAAAVGRPSLRAKVKASGFAARAAAPEAAGQLMEANAKVAGPHLQKALDTEAAQHGASASSVMQLAGAGNGVAGGSTWPGYSNLMYCDPVVCSGPMQVIHIQVPAEQVDAAAAQNQGKARKSFVNADVVVGPDGVARAIRVAN